MLHKLRSIWTLARQECTATFLSSRLVFLIASRIVAYESAFASLIELSGKTDLPVHPLEPYLVLSARPISALMIPLMYVLFLSGMPSAILQRGMVMVRTSRLRWFTGQMLAVTVTALLYILILLVFSIAITWPTLMQFSFGLNWNPLMLEIRERFPEIYDEAIGYLLRGSTTMQGYPLRVLLHSITLMLLSIVMQGELLLIFDLIEQKMLGFLVLIAINGLGCTLVSVEHPVMWGLPMAHTIFGLHFVNAAAEPAMPLVGSYLYFAGWIILLGGIGCLLAKRMAFHEKPLFLSQH